MTYDQLVEGAELQGELSIYRDMLGMLKNTDDKQSCRRLLYIFNKLDDNNFNIEEDVKEILLRLREMFYEEVKDFAVRKIPVIEAKINELEQQFLQL